MTGIGKLICVEGLLTRVSFSVDVLRRIQRQHIIEQDMGEGQLAVERVRVGIEATCQPSDDVDVLLPNGYVEQARTLTQSTHSRAASINTYIYNKSYYNKHGHSYQIQACNCRQ